MAPVPEESVSPTPRSKIRARIAPGSSSAYQETLVRFGNCACGFDRGARRGKVERGRARRRARRRSRIADCRSRRAGRPTRDPRSATLPRPSGGPPGKSAEVNEAWPMSTRQLSRAGDRRRGSPRRPCRSRTRLVGPAAVAQVQDRLAGAVARQLGLRAVGVEDPQLGDVPGSRGLESSSTPSANRPKCGVAQQPHTRGGQLEGKLVALDDQVVVAEGLPLLEAHRHGVYGVEDLARDGRRVPPGHVDHVHAASLRIQVSWRRA